MVLRLTCPYTSQQNGRAERVLRTLNDSLHTMLLHANAPLSFWPDALVTATYLLNRRPCHTRNNLTPYQLLLGVPPDYSHLRVFGCRCYPNTAATAPHKLVTRSQPCIFLGYPADTKGYRCYNPECRRVLTSRHVHFDESCFPFRLLNSPHPASHVVPTVPNDTILVPISTRITRWPAPPQRAPAPPTPSTGPTTGDPPVTNVLDVVGPAHPSPVATPGDLSGTPSLSPIPDPPPDPRLHPPPHPMVTRSRTGTLRPNLRYACVATTSVPAVPSSVHAALWDPDWRATMQLEFDALQANRTYSLVLRPPGANVISGKWVFKNKLQPDGSLE
jgi:hypothetical protein